MPQRGPQRPGPGVEDQHRKDRCKKQAVPRGIRVVLEAVFDDAGVQSDMRERVGGAAEVV